MWAQLSSTRVKEGQVDAVGRAMEQLRTFEQPDSGLLRTMVLQDQNDPTHVFVLVVFESEEKARAREADPRREEGVQALRKDLAEVLAGAPEYTDLTVLADLVP
ncbi:MAG: antibiotic biosynthesis monooxygenase [Nocardioides sp.]